MDDLFAKGELIADRYRVIEQIGSGAMGTVYRVEDCELAERTLALKLHKPAMALSEKSIGRFRREVLLLRQLSDPHVVRIFDFARTKQGLYFLTMEYLEGRSLAAVIAQPPSAADLTSRLALLLGVARGLKAIHEQGIIHRDIKAENVLISADGTAKLADFGIARAGDADQQYTMTGEALGTPYYMSPELFMGKRGSSSSDVYAFGVLMYEALCGQKPYHGATFYEIANLHLQAPIPEFPPETEAPRWCRLVVKECLDKRPENRPTVHQIIGALQEGIRRGDSWRYERSLPHIRYRARQALVSSSFRTALIWLAAVCLLFAGCLREIRRQDGFQTNLLVSKAVIRAERAVGQALGRDVEFALLRKMLAVTLEDSPQQVCRAIRGQQLQELKVLFDLGYTLQVTCDGESDLLRYALQFADWKMIALLAARLKRDYPPAQYQSRFAQLTLELMQLGRLASVQLLLKSADEQLLTAVRQTVDPHGKRAVDYLSNLPGGPLSFTVKQLVEGNTGGKGANTL